MKGRQQTAAAFVFADNSHPMNDDQLLRYSRHILLDEIGIEGQEKMLAAHAVIVGAGGLGSPAALYMASAGVGTITLIDDDTVDLTNLQRQIAHTTARVGQGKAASCATALREINPSITVHTIAERIDADALGAVIANATVVLDCTDNYRTRHAINLACVRHGVPLVSGAAIRFDGQISVFDRRRTGAACYACLFAPEEQFEEVSCSTMGVFAPLVGIIGAMQAAEALKLIAGVGSSLDGRLMMLEALRMEWNTMNVSANPHCTVCAKHSPRA